MIYLIILCVFATVAWKIIASPSTRRIGDDADGASPRPARGIGVDAGRDDAAWRGRGDAGIAGAPWAAGPSAPGDWPGEVMPPPAGDSAPAGANTALAAALLAARTAALTAAVEGRATDPASGPAAGEQRRPSARMAMFHRAVYGPGVCSPR